MPNTFAADFSAQLSATANTLGTTPPSGWGEDDFFNSKLELWANALNKPVSQIQFAWNLHNSANHFSSAPVSATTTFGQAWSG